jgi:uncharacterized membrane protein
VEEVAGAEDRMAYGFGCGMMNGFAGGYGTGMMIFSWLFGLLSLIALFLLIVWLTKHLQKNK